MDVFLCDEDGNMHETVEQAAESACVEEGEEFSVVKITVISRHTYRIVDGKPVQVAIAFPDCLV